MMDIRQQIQDKLRLDPQMPVGVRLVGFFNLLFPGLLAFVMFLLILPSEEKLIDLFRSIGGSPMHGTAFTVDQMRLMVLPQGAIALFYLISAWGLLQCREWARRATVWFSFAIMILLAVAVVFGPSMIGRVLLQAVHPAVMIFYLTGAPVVMWFSSKEQKEQ